MKPHDDWNAFDPFDDSDPFADENFEGKSDADLDSDPFANESEDDFDVEAELERQEDEFWNAMDSETNGEDEAELAEILAWGETNERQTRCPHCGTTWERIRSDGRVGCASCYATFRSHMGNVMARMQNGASHVGKTPRAAQKRRLRLEHLRKRRDNQLALLQSRLGEAVSAERYEEAAKLRDKIKVVSASIFAE